MSADGCVLSYKRVLVMSLDHLVTACIGWYNLFEQTYYKMIYTTLWVIFNIFSNYIFSGVERKFYMAIIICRWASVEEEFEGSVRQVWKGESMHSKSGIIFQNI